MSIFAMEQFIKIKKIYYYYKRNYMVGVILSVLHILSAIFVVFLILRHLYKMYKKIQVKDWRSVLLDVITLAICVPIFYHHFFVTYDVSKAFTEITTYFS